MMLTVVMASRSRFPPGHCNQNTGLCLCNSPYSGSYCQNKLCVHGCYNGACDTTTGTCTCTTGFYGEQCILRQYTVTISCSACKSSVAAAHCFDCGLPFSRLQARAPATGTARATRTPVSALAPLLGPVPPAPLARVRMTARATAPVTGRQGRARATACMSGRTAR
jgi:hypothetical protein